MADNISSSKKEIYTKLMDIAEKYVDVKNTDFLKTGLFGYITESLAMMIRDSTLHKSMIYNESFLNTAVIPKSVYNWAKMFNVEVQRATPKYAEVEIQIDTTYLDSLLKSNIEEIPDYLKYGTDVTSLADNNDIGLLILDKESPIIAGEYYFALEHSILIKKKSNVYRAQYITTEYESTSFESNVNKILTTKISNDNLIIKARLYQYQIRTFKRTITSSTFLNKQQIFTFEDQFCGAKLFYEENGTDNEINLQYSDIAAIDQSNVAFYNLNNENELEINFKNGDNYYMPSVNTKLKVFVYTTKGLSAPKNFSGDATMILNDSSLKSLPIVILFNPTSLLGGKDAPTISEIKQTIINEISTRNTITTKTDMDNYFNILTSLISDINDGKVTFVKKRDDILRRMYNAYLLVRDNTNDSADDTSNSLSACAPTNTIDVKINVDDTESIAKINPKFKYMAALNTPHEQAEDSDTSYYICPFLMYLYKDKPINYVKYIYTMTDSTSPLVYSMSSNNTFSDVSSSIIPVSINVYRGFDPESGTGYNIDNKYTITITLTTPYGLGKVSSTVESYKTVSGKISIGDYECDLLDDSSEVFSEDSGDGQFTTTIKVLLPVSDGAEFKPDDGFNFNAIHINDKSFLSSQVITVDLSEMKINGAVTGIKLESSLKVVFYQKLDDIIESNIIYDNNNKIAGIKEVPVVHSSFFDTTSEVATTRREGFVKQLFTYIQILKNSLSKLETSTFFNLKFYNTYGFSRRYSTPYTNLKLQLKISLTSSNDNGDNIKQNIRSYTRKAIDAMNNSGAINISALISALTSAYGDYIKQITFVSLNGTFELYIAPLTTLTDDELDQYPPEWLNLDASYLSDENLGIVFETT